MRTFVRRTARNLVVCALPSAVAASLGRAAVKPMNRTSLCPPSAARKANVPAVPTLPTKAIKAGTRTPSMAPCTICGAVCTTAT